jgi:hypothetical protein
MPKRGRWTVRTPVVVKVRPSQFPYHETYLATNRDGTLLFQAAVTPKRLDAMDDFDFLATLRNTVLHLEGATPRQEYSW